MAYETKVILSLLAQQISRLKTIKQAYNAIVEAASVEGVQLPSYEDVQKKIKQEENE
jgi:hypothetical protein